MKTFSHTLPIEKALHDNAGQSQKAKRIRAKSPLKVKRQDGKEITLKGRNAQVMRVLIARRHIGVTGLNFSLATTAFRYSNIICELRKLGFAIETTYEAAGDCTIGRYWLRDSLALIEGGANA